MMVLVFIVLGNIFIKVWRCLFVCTNKRWFSGQTLLLLPRFLSLLTRGAHKLPLSSSLRLADRLSPLVSGTMDSALAGLDAAAFLHIWQHFDKDGRVLMSELSGVLF